MNKPDDPGPPVGPARQGARGPVRKALSAWADEWRRSGRPGGLTAYELADLVPGMSSKSPADMRMVWQTVRNMVAAGELANHGPSPGPRFRRPRSMYGPPAEGAKPAQRQRAAPDAQAAAELAAALDALWSQAPRRR